MRISGIWSKHLRAPYSVSRLDELSTNLIGNYFMLSMQFLITWVGKVSVFQNLENLSSGCPKKNQKCLIDHRRKRFCSIINFSFDLNRKHSNLDLETKFAKIR